MAASKKSTATQSRRSKSSASGKSTAKSNSTKRNTKKSTSSGRSKRSTSAKSSSSKNNSAKNRRSEPVSREAIEEEMERREEFHKEIALWGLVAVSLLLFVSNLGFGGTVGTAISSIFFGVFGFMAYLFPVVLLIGSLFYYVNRGNPRANRMLAATGFLLFFLCMLISLLAHGEDVYPPLREYFYSVQNRFAGGLLGGCLSWLCANAFGLVGAYIIDVIGIIICFVLITGRSLMRGMARGGRKVMQTAHEAQEERRSKRELRMDRKVSGVTLNTQIIDEGTPDELKEQNESKVQDASDEATALDTRSSKARKRLDRSAVSDASDQPNGSGKSDSRRLTDPSSISDTLDAGKTKKSKSGRTLRYGSDKLQELFANPNQLADELEQKLSDMENMEAEQGAQSDTETRYTPDDEKNGGIYNKKSRRKEAGEKSAAKRKRHIPVMGGLNDSLQELTPFDDIVDLDDLDDADDFPSQQPYNGAQDMWSRSQAGAEPWQTDAALQQTGSRAKRTGASTQRPEDDASQQDLTADLPQHLDADAGILAEAPEYMLPPTSLLEEPKQKNGSSNTQELRETAQKLQTTLDTFGVKVAVTDVSCGPTVTRYEIQPEAGVKVSKIVHLADDIKLNLAAADIRIEAPIPGKAAIGIEVPNKENVTVPFRELVESPEFQNSKSKISFAVGKDISGKPVVADIAKMPHVLIAGATGSGKSVCINTIIMSVLFHAKPDEVKMILIDPKVVELNVYRGIPHLMIDVVTDPKKAAAALNWAVEEMTERYQKFADAGVRKLEEYNEKVDSINVPEGQEKPQKMCQILIVVDELADLMMVASREVEDSICRLAQLARAAGIHLVIATQRPSVNVITGLIKANMPSRIAFAVTSGVDSRTILDMNGAEKLLGKGDMLFYPQGLPKPIRVQGALVSDEEVSRVVSYIKDQNGPVQYSDAVQKKMSDYETGGDQPVAIHDVEPDDSRDAYFLEAARVVVDKEKASIGMFQRAFKIGFNRAARIMDQLEEAGVVGPEVGTKPRKVLMNAEELQEFIDENE